jgi:hypothetical protein
VSNTLPKPLSLGAKLTLRRRPRPRGATAPFSFADETGSAVIDLLGFGVLLQVPLLALTLQLVSMQHDQLAAEAITRDGLRSYLLLGLDPEATAAQLAADYRVPSSRIKLAMTCQPGSCEETGSFVRLTTQVGSAKATGVMQR